MGEELIDFILISDKKVFVIAGETERFEEGIFNASGLIDDSELLLSHGLRGADQVGILGGAHVDVKTRRVFRAQAGEREVVGRSFT